MKTGDLKKWVAIGTGVGIEIAGEDLRISVVRVRPFGATVLGLATLRNFRQRPASEWGSEYHEFLRKLGVSYLAANVLLPRRDVIVRPLNLPGLADRDLEGAIRLELDSLHPFPEDQALCAWRRVGHTPAVLIGITRQPVIDEYMTLFGEAGIKVAGFTFSAAVLRAALRLFLDPPAEGFISLYAMEGGVEVYGESQARPVFSASFLNGLADRARSLAAAELRLDPEIEPVDLGRLLPAPLAAPEGFSPSHAGLLYATALCGACPRVVPSINLLPEALRATPSPALFIPTLVLTVALIGVLIALGLSGAIENREYLASLEREIARVDLKARKVRSLDTAIEETVARTRLLDDFRGGTKADVDALNELTRILRPPTWLSSLEMNRTTVNLAGQTEQATSLLKVIDSSGLFHNSEFTMPFARVGSYESFRIRSVRPGMGR